MSEWVVLVDEHDRACGAEEKLRAHHLGLLHRAFSIFVFRLGPNGYELLLQQRAADKYHSPLLWSNTCCGHPRPLETLVSAAQRRLYEEMGLQTPLQWVDQFCYRAVLGSHLIEHEWDHIFIGFDNGEPVLNPAEARDYAWLPVTHLQDGRSYTAWFAEAVALALGHLPG